MTKNLLTSLSTFLLFDQFTIAARRAHAFAPSSRSFLINRHQLREALNISFVGSYEICVLGWCTTVLVLFRGAMRTLPAQPKKNCIRNRTFERDTLALIVACTRAETSLRLLGNYTKYVILTPIHQRFTQGKTFSIIHSVW